jgi:hypothetical protein
LMFMRCNSFNNPPLAPVGILIFASVRCNESFQGVFYWRF